jgi:DNA-binding GntR family transcriptional regulator
MVTPDPVLMPLPREEETKLSLAGRAYEGIKEKILTGAIAPLSTIDERRLMEELDMGRTPVREALQRLAFEGLVTIIPYRGTLASGLDMSDLDQIMEIRIPLETLAARHAAERISREEVEALRELVSGYDIPRLCAERRFDELLHLDQRFHDGVSLIARNKFVVRTLRNLRDLTWRFYIVYHKRHPAAPTDSFNNYVQIIDALERHDPDLVERLLEEHFRDTRHIFSR